MNLTVGTTPEALDPSGVPDVRDSGLVLIVQNRGPSSVFFDFDEDVTTDSGVEIAAGGSYEFPRAGTRTVWMVSDDEADVRWAAID